MHAAYVLLQQCHDEIKVDFYHSWDVTTLAVVHTQVCIYIIKLMACDPVSCLHWVAKTMAFSTANKTEFACFSQTVQGSAWYANYLTVNINVLGRSYVAAQIYALTIQPIEPIERTIFCKGVLLRIQGYDVKCTTSIQGVSLSYTRQSQLQLHLDPVY